MSWVDLAIGAGTAAAAYRGYRRGLVGAVAAWGGFLVGVLFAGLVAPVLLSRVAPRSPGPRVAFAAVLFLALVFAVVIPSTLVGRRLQRRFARTELARLDRATGIAVSVSIALVASWLIGVALARGPTDAITAGIRGSALIGAFEARADAPVFMARMRRFLARTGFPDAFEELNPALSPAVPPAPDGIRLDPEVVRAATAVLKVETPDCGGVVGTGFPVAPGLVLTAAHVVAGATEVAVTPVAGSPLEAVPVYLDVRRDLALLEVADLTTKPLRFDPAPFTRGDTGAAIGFGRGDLGIVPVRVRGGGAALGRDIYFRSLVGRDLYVLRGDVRPGDSGGPVVDRAGNVRGILFAGSPADGDDEGYAMSQVEIDRVLAQGAKLRPVPPGECAL